MVLEGGVAGAQPLHKGGPKARPPREKPATCGAGYYGTRLLGRSEKSREIEFRLGRGILLTAV